MDQAVIDLIATQHGKGRIVIMEFDRGSVTCEVVDRSSGMKEAYHWSSRGVDDCGSMTYALLDSIERCGRSIDRRMQQSGAHPQWSGARIMAKHAQPRGVTDPAAAKRTLAEDGEFRRVRAVTQAEFEDWDTGVAGGKIEAGAVVGLDVTAKVVNFKGTGTLQVGGQFPTPRRKIDLQDLVDQNNDLAESLGGKGVEQKIHVCGQELERPRCKLSDLLDGPPAEPHPQSWRDRPPLI